MGGRLGWAAISDRLGTRNTFHLLCLSSVPLLLALPATITACTAAPASPLAPLHLAAFCTASVAAVSVMGGVFSVLPPYEATLYGPKYVGPIHGKFLPFSTIRGLAGPALLLYLRQAEEKRAVEKLLASVDPQQFQERFGVAVSQAGDLLAVKSLNLTKLVTVLPPGMQDPTPFLYHSTMFSLAGLAAVASLLHLAVKPVDIKHFEKTSK